MKYMRVNKKRIENCWRSNQYVLYPGHAINIFKSDYLNNSISKGNSQFIFYLAMMPER